MNREWARKTYDTPGVAMCDGRIIHRWDRSGDSHWILGSKQTFDGVSYRLIDIKTTPNLIFLFCERT